MFCALNRVIDEEVYSELMNAGDVFETIKLLVHPINLPVPIPVKGPKTAVPMGKYFGRRACWEEVGGHIGGFRCDTLSVDMYAVWILRHSLQVLCFAPGRTCDLHLAGYKQNAVLASFRLACTDWLVANMRRGSESPKRKQRLPGTRN